jgi:hypothetical protein
MRGERTLDDEHRRQKITAEKWYARYAPSHGQKK